VGNRTGSQPVLEQVRVGLVGVGAMGREFLVAARDHPDVVIAACADADPRRLAALRQEEPDLAVESDWRRLVESPDLDAILVATPPDFHAEVTIAAFEAGKAVLCEKPLASRLEDGRRMVEAARASGLVNRIHFPFCDRKPVLEIERAVRAGELGRLRAVEVRLLFPEWPRPFQAHAGWIATRSQGGLLREVFTHFAYLTDRIVGPLEVEAVDLRSTGDDAAESFVAARFSAAETPVTLLGLTDAALTETYEWTLYGERQSLRLRDWRHLERFADGRWQPVTFEGDLGSERTRLTELARAVRSEPSRLPDFPTGYRIQQVIEACHAAAAAG